MPVTDVDRARRLSTSLGWREDADVASSGEVRIAPGDLRGVGYVVADVEAVDHRVDPHALELFETARRHGDLRVDRAVLAGPKLTPIQVARFVEPVKRVA